MNALLEMRVIFKSHFLGLKKCTKVDSNILSLCSPTHGPLESHVVPFDSKFEGLFASHSANCVMGPSGWEDAPPIPPYFLQPINESNSLKKAVRLHNFRKPTLNE